MGTAQTPIQRVLRAVSPGVKQQGSEADHSPPSSAEVMNAGILSLIPIRLHAMGMII
jgi:hypothetical protein